MKMRIKAIIIGLLLPLAAVAGMPATLGEQVTWDKYSLIIGGRRVCPVMGEIHYSRIPADEWQQEIRKMKDGGVTT